MKFLSHNVAPSFMMVNDNAMAAVICRASWQEVQADIVLRKKKQLSFELLQQHML